MFSKSNPIGVIDSGIGGYSVVRKVQEFLPNENLIYFGDGANTPYGNHTADEILEMTRYMLHFMEEKQVKALLVACNTISCLIDYYRGDMSCPVFSIVEAGADAVKKQDLSKVAVLSTCFTAKSKCYPELIKKLSPETEVISFGCPDLAKVIEQYAGSPEGQNVINNTLQREMEDLINTRSMDYCVLGCTHYPLAEENIHRLFPQLHLIDPAIQMTDSFRAYLKSCGLLNDSVLPGRLDIFTTGSLEEYIKKANRMGLKNIMSVQFYSPMSLCGMVS